MNENGNLTQGELDGIIASLTTENEELKNIAKATEESMTVFWEKYEKLIDFLKSLKLEKQKELELKNILEGINKAKEKFFIQFDDRLDKKKEMPDYSYIKSKEEEEKKESQLKASSQLGTITRLYKQAEPEKDKLPQSRRGRILVKNEEKSQYNGIRPTRILIKKKYQEKEEEAMPSINKNTTTNLQKLVSNEKLEQPSTEPKGSENLKKLVTRRHFPGQGDEKEVVSLKKAGFKLVRPLEVETGKKEEEKKLNKEDLYKKESAEVKKFRIGQKR